MRTICDPCARGEHGRCSEIVPRAVDDLGRPIARAGYIECRCFCDVRDRIVEHLNLAAAAAKDGRLAEAQKHADAARELLGPEEPPAIVLQPRRKFVLPDPGRFYEGASARRGGGRS